MSSHLNDARGSSAVVGRQRNNHCIGLSCRFSREITGGRQESLCRNGLRGARSVLFAGHFQRGSDKASRFVFEQMSQLHRCMNLLPLFVKDATSR